MEEPGGAIERRELAERVRRACVRAAAEVYEQAREDGLCAEGAWEAAIAAVYALDLGPLTRSDLGAAESR